MVTFLYVIGEFCLILSKLLQLPLQQTNKKDGSTILDVITVIFYSKCSEVAFIQADISILRDEAKSNLFGYGYQGGGHVSIGCSYKGKVWMGCGEYIDTNHILNNSLALEVIKEFPEGVPYKILLPEIIEISNSSIMWSG